jgi:hypothetical protein
MTRLALLALLLPSSALAGWQDDVANARSACDRDASLCEVVDDLGVRENRAGLWFVQDSRLQVVHLPLLLHRMLQEDDPMMRAALATGAAQLLTDADEGWHPAWAELAATDPSPQVRSIFITELRRAPLTAAGPGLRGALAHEDAITRRDAAAIMGRQLEAKAFVDDLIGALRDDDIVVRRTVVRALGHAADPKAADAVRAALLADDRLANEARRALERMGEAE